MRILSVLFVTLLPVLAYADEATDVALKRIPAQLEDFTYKFKVDHFQHRPAVEGAIVMLGDSLTDLGGWNEFFPEAKVINRGISGDNTLGMLNRVDQVISLKPKQVFILAGTNDLFFGANPEDVLERYKLLIDAISDGVPDAEVVLQTVPPYHRKAGGDYGYLDNDKVRTLNTLLIEEAAELDLKVIDLYSLVAKNGELDTAKTTDGIHLNGEGYAVWAASLNQFINR